MSQNGSAGDDRGGLRREWFAPLTAADASELMMVPCRRGPYRVPLAQFISDWNRCDDPAWLVAADPAGGAADPVALATIAAVVHALCERDGVAVPAWVLDHRAERDTVLFAADPESPDSRRVRKHAPAASAFHRVYFPTEMLDKGSAAQWDEVKA